MPEASQQVRDEAHFVRPRHLPGVELVSVAYRNRSFPVHTHPEYVIGAVVAGAETLSVRGVSHLLAAGSTLFLPPDEAHANATAGEARLRYRVLYVSAAGLPATMFRGPTSAAPHLFEAVVHAHEVLSQSDDRLEQETTLHGPIRSAQRGRGRDIGAGIAAAPADGPRARLYRRAFR